jgi:hypothetical protein
MSDSLNDLLEHIRSVPIEEYQKCRQRLAESEAPRRFIAQFHREPKKTITRLLDRYVEHQRELAITFPMADSPLSVCNIKTLRALATLPAGFQPEFRLLKNRFLQKSH